MITWERLEMPTNDTLDRRLRSVEQNATAAAHAPASVNSNQFAVAQRSANEMIQRIKERYEKAGARPDALAATVSQSGISYRLEVTMESATAEALYGPATDARNRDDALARAFANMREQISGPQRSGLATHWQDLAQRLEFLRARLDQPSLPEWMQIVLRLDEENQPDSALDELFRRIDALLSSREFQEVDDALAVMPVEGPSLTVMMGLLSITRPAAEHLSSRERFFNRVYRLCKAMRRDADSLLGGLR